MIYRRGPADAIFLESTCVSVHLFLFLFLSCLLARPHLPFVRITHYVVTKLRDLSSNRQRPVGVNQNLPELRRADGN